MKACKAIRLFTITPILFLLFPNSGNAEVSGSVFVFSTDSKNSSTAPPSTLATLNGTNILSYGSNDLVTFSGFFQEGIHSVEVATEASGYVLRQSPTDPNAINDPDSEYGNPRNVTFTQGVSYVSEDFIFDPVISASATVRDSFTMERLEDVYVIFVWEDGTNAFTKTKYPSHATYATNWVTDASGAFPTDTIMYLHDYDLFLSTEGYEDLYASNIIMDASPGDHFELGTMFLTPADLNTNGIGDAWESLHFGTGCDELADPDSDGLSNREEYLAGTDPNDWYSCLWLFQNVETNGTILFQWETVPDRTYRLSGTTNLCSDTWVQVAGAWEAANGQFSMSWAETNHHLSWNSSYRLEVMPAGWTGTNSILIRTNDWPTSGGGSYTNTPGGFPPLPR